MESCIFSKISTDKGIPLRLHLTISNQSVQLTILLKEKAFKSLVAKEELLNFAEQHKFNLDNYCQKLLEYLTDDQSSVIFILHDTEFIVNRVLNNTLKVKFFTCILEKADYVNEVEQIIDSLHFKYNETSEKFESLSRELKEINENKIYCETKLTELVNKKVLDENEQFGQFVLILNEKKRRIQHLEELLEAFKKGRPTSNSLVVSGKNQRKSKSQKPSPTQKKETISDSEPSISSEDEQSGSTSEENSNQENQHVEESKPSTSTELFSLLEDDNSHSHSLPKRIKVNSNANDIVVTKVEPSESSTEKNKETEKNVRSKTPEIELNTQQLLDML